MSDNHPASAPPKGGVVAYLNLDGALKAADFYIQAFGAEIAAAHPGDAKGRTPHVHLYINGSSVMLSDFFPEHGHAPSPASGFNLMLRVDNADAWYKRAIDAGCSATMPPQDMFWGDRYGQLKDPFGVTWAVNQVLKK